MTLEELRGRIDVLDRQLVELLSERARAALMIGHLKAATSLPVYEPAREKVIYANVRAANKGGGEDNITVVFFEIQPDADAGERTVTLPPPEADLDADLPSIPTGPGR